MRRDDMWSEARTDELKALAIDGYSAMQIARILGGGLTRSAVCGKMHRMGLQLGVGGGMRLQAARVAKPKPQKPAPITRESAAELLARELPPTDDPFSAQGCRWPIGEVGDPDFRFCQRPRGKRAAGGLSSWCEGHHAIGHDQRPQAKRNAA